VFRTDAVQESSPHIGFSLFRPLVVESMLEESDDLVEGVEALLFSPLVVERTFGKTDDLVGGGGRRTWGLHSPHSLGNSTLATRLHASHSVWNPPSGLAISQFIRSPHVLHCPQLVHAIVFRTVSVQEEEPHICCCCSCPLHMDAMARMNRIEQMLDSLMKKIIATLDMLFVRLRAPSLPTPE